MCEALGQASLPEGLQATRSARSKGTGSTTTATLRGCFFNQISSSDNALSWNLWNASALA
jgi:hypothetical protein